MKEIIHIVGLNKEYKEGFIKKLISIDPTYLIIDIDDLTQKISNTDKMSKLFDQYEKIKSDKNKSKNLANDINTEWARELQSKLNKLLSSAVNITILIGLTTSVINNGPQKIHIDLPTNYKFIVDIDLIENAKHIIKNNLKEYKHSIINGKFPLEYLNLDFLIKRREQFNQIYLKSFYVLKKLDDIYTFMKEHLKNIADIKVKKLYYTSEVEMSKTISTKNLKLFNDEIESMLYIFKLANLKYDKANKTIYELSKDSLKELEKDCHIYEITDMDGIFFDGEYFKNNKKIKINKSTYIDCVFLMIEKLGIKYVKFNSNYLKTIKPKTEIKDQQIEVKQKTEIKPKTEVKAKTEVKPKTDNLQNVSAKASV